MALCETGTRGLLGAVFGPTSTGEPDYARQLLPLLDQSMLLLADRNFSGDEFLNDVAGTGAEVLARLTYRRRPAVITVLPDGSYLTRLRGRTFRIIEADVTADCADGSHVGQRDSAPWTAGAPRRSVTAEVVTRQPSAWAIRAPAPTAPARMARLAGSDG